MSLFSKFFSNKKGMSMNIHNHKGCLSMNDEAVNLDIGGITGDGNISIGGKTYKGNNISITNNEIYVDGVKQENDLSKLKEINIIIEKDSMVQGISSSCSLNIKGDVVGNVIADGYVECNNVEGNVQTDGSIRCNNIGYNANAGGSLRCGDIRGNANAGGSIKANKIYNKGRK